jgi:hypothetical protein
MDQLTVSYSIRLTELQHRTLKRLKGKYNINPQHFIREAIMEKLKKERKQIQQRGRKPYTPF